MNKHTRKPRIIKFTLFILAMILITIYGLYELFSYDAEPDAMSWMETSEVVEVTDSNDTIYFSSSSNSDKVRPTIIFYNGALVDERSYSELANKLAEQGFPVYIVKSLFNLPLLANDEPVLSSLKNTEQVILMGHSLGGVQAAKRVNGLLSDSTSSYPSVVGLVLLASYPAQNNDLSQLDVPVLSITATQDKVLNTESFTDSMLLLPPQTIYHRIEGGNHAGFGDYGPQDGDGDATISNEAQINDIVQQINNIW